MSERRCSVEGCERKYSCRGLCNTHYERARNSGTIEIRRLQPARCGTLYMYQKGCRCEPCRKAATDYDRKWRTKNPEAHKRRNRVRHMRKTFGMEIADYQSMLDGQGGVCAICGCPPGTKEGRQNLCIDHDHESGVVRGILCGPCNRAIGLLGDDARVVGAALRYLETHSRTGAA